MGSAEPAADRRPEAHLPALHVLGREQVGERALHQVAHVSCAESAVAAGESVDRRREVVCPAGEGRLGTPNGV